MTREHFNTIDSIRERIGLSRPEMARLLEDADTPAERERVAHELERVHQSFRRSLRKRVLEEAEIPDAVVNGYACLSTGQVSRALGLGEWHIANMRKRGKIDSLSHKGRPVYRVSEILSLIDWVPRPRQHHSPLTAVFLRHLEERALAADVSAAS